MLQCTVHVLCIEETESLVNIYCTFRCSNAQLAKCLTGPSGYVYKSGTCLKVGKFYHQAFKLSTEDVQYFLRNYIVIESKVT